MGVISRHNLLRHRTRQEIEKLARSHNGHDMDGNVTRRDSGGEESLVLAKGERPPEIQI